MERMENKIKLYRLLREFCFFVKHHQRFKLFELVKAVVKVYCFHGVLGFLLVSFISHGIY